MDLYISFIIKAILVVFVKRISKSVANDNAAVVAIRDKAFVLYIVALQSWRSQIQ